ncbi:MAG: hypothetical protein LBU32_01280 [Clostridiales bacterium]|jgi:hypothetical protein|nr:hypothetical protein [Clostridiales bacterium]
MSGNSAFAADIFSKMNQTGNRAKPREEEVKPSLPSEKNIKSILKRYSNLPLPQDSADILIALIHEMKESDAGYLKWKEHIKDAKKCLKKNGYRFD